MTKNFLWTDIVLFIMYFTKDESFLSQPELT